HELGTTLALDQPRSHELLALGASATGAAEDPAPEQRQRVADPLQRKHCRPDEELEADERRDRVARQPEHERRSAYAEGDRLPGLDRDAPEDLLDAEVRLELPDEIVRPHRDPPRGDDDVGGERMRERSRVCLLVVAARVEPLDVGACAGQLRGEDQAVGLVDFSWSKWYPRRP